MALIRLKSQRCINYRYPVNISPDNISIDRGDIINSVDQIQTSGINKFLSIGSSISKSNTDMKTSMQSSRVTPDNSVILQTRQIGGASRTVFTNMCRLYILADITDVKIIRNFHDRLKNLGLSKTDQSKSKPHITLMEVIVNRSHPSSHLLLDANGKVMSQLSSYLEQCYAAVSPQMYLTSKKGKYEIMGDFMAKVYTANNTSYITDFRINLYRYIEALIGKGRRRIVIIDNKRYFMYTYHGKDLIAVPEYYHGKGVWKPHLSLIKLERIKKLNPRLYDLYIIHGVTAIVDALRGSKGSVDHLNMSLHLSSLRITSVCSR